MTPALIFLKADIYRPEEAWKDAELREALDVSTVTVEKIRKKFVEEGL